MSTHRLRGLLYPHEAETRFTLDGYEPSAALRPFVERHFGARWDMPVRYVQSVLPCPCFYLLLGANLTGVYGVAKRALQVELQGSGWLFGTRFRPGGFRAFLDRSAAELRGRVVPLAELFGPAGLALERAVAEAGDDLARIELVEGFLRARAPEHSEAARSVDRALDVIRREPELSRVADLAARVGVSVRVLEIRFRDYLGVTPKAAIQRCRVLEATDRVALGGPLPWATMAQAHGYADQAHLIREFKHQVGDTRAHYADRCQTPTE